MSALDDFNENFSTPSSYFVLVCGAVACLRFAGAEWDENDLIFRLTMAGAILASVIMLGILFGIFSAILSANGPSYGNKSRSRYFFRGMKVGIFIGFFFVTLIGFLMVDNFLGPIEVVFNKIIEKIP